MFLPVVGNVWLEINVYKRHYYQTALCINADNNIVKGEISPKCVNWEQW